MIERYRLKDISAQTAKPKKRTANKKHLTDKNVLNLPPKSRQYRVWDNAADGVTGLSVLISPMGTRTYSATYYFPGSPKPHYKSLGRVGELTLDEARRLTREARGKARKGEDPNENSLARSENFKVAVETYIKDRARAKENVSGAATQNVMLNNCKDWWFRPVATIRFQEIDTLLGSVRDGDEKSALKPRPYLANRLYSHLKDFFRWCVRKKLAVLSPMAEMELPWRGAKPRDLPWFKGRAADEAIKALWLSADQFGGDGGRYLKILLLTGKRKSAIANMRWEEIDEDWFWNAPKPLSKTKRLHPIPLPSLVRQNLHPREKAGPIFRKLNFEGLQDRIRSLTKIESFIFHGIRHVTESKFAELKVPPHIRDLLFDHAPQRGTGKDYDHHEYHEEMREALELWADHVQKIVAPKGTIALR